MSRSSVGTLTFDYVRPGGRVSTFQAHLLHADSSHLIFTHIALPSTHSLLYQGNEVIAGGYTVVWFVFQGRSYDIGRFYRPDGTWTGYYIDILEPVHWELPDSPVLSPLIDLALDLWIAPDGSQTVLDKDEFDAFTRDGSLSAVQVEHARSVLRELQQSAANKAFPPTMVRDFQSIDV